MLTRDLSGIQLGLDRSLVNTHATRGNLITFFTLRYYTLLTMMTDVEVYDMEFSFGLWFSDNDDIRDVSNLVLLPQKPYQTAPSIFFWRPDYGQS